MTVHITMKQVSRVICKACWTENKNFKFQISKMHLQEKMKSAYKNVQNWMLHKLNTPTHKY